MGATPGGAQDITFFRDRVLAGEVPHPNTFTPEGLFSEHDLPLRAGPPCPQLLCVAGEAVPRPARPARGPLPRAARLLLWDRPEDLPARPAAPRRRHRQVRLDVWPAARARQAEPHPSPRSARPRRRALDRPLRRPLHVYLQPTADPRPPRRSPPRSRGSRAPAPPPWKRACASASSSPASTPKSPGRRRPRHALHRRAPQRRPHRRRASWAWPAPPPRPASA
jgi:hypothetical protein